MKRFVSLAAVSLLVISGCGKSYGDFEPGEFQGRLIVEWYDKDIFIFRPDKKQPLQFTRHGSETPIEPKLFRTDGGSTPRILRAFKHYSPWGYAKAYIIHDWIFAEHYCGRAEVGFEESANILSEGVKTMILDHGDTDPAEHKVLEAIDAGVRSSFARKSWDTGACKTVTDTGIETFDLGARKGVFVVE